MATNGRLATVAVGGGQGQPSVLRPTHLNDIDVRVECPKAELARPFRRKVTVRLIDSGKEVHSFDAAPETVFARDGATLYIARPMPGACGCVVTAYDFRMRKELWQIMLQSPFAPKHSAYGNQVTIETAGDGVLLVRGSETLRRYVEIVDMRSGKSLARRDYPRE